MQAGGLGADANSFPSCLLSKKNARQPPECDLSHLTWLPESNRCFGGGDDKALALS